MKRVITLLIIVLVFTEFLVMTFLANFSSYFENPWLEALLDAVVVSIVATITISYLLKISPELPAIKAKEWLMIKIGAVVFIIETIFMLSIYLVNITLHEWLKIIMDVIIIGILTPLIIYIAILRPEISSQHEIQPTTKLRLTIWVTYAATLFALALLLMTNYKMQSQQFEKELLEKEEHLINIVSSQLYDYLYHSKLDILMLASQTEFKQTTQPNPQAMAKFHIDYSNLLKVKNYYIQARYLDARGNEIIRVERNNNQIQVIVSKDLQNKADRYYFQKAKKLQRGEIYISPLDLNIEHGQLVIPYQPMIRLATPIVNDKGDFTGVIVLNMDGSNLLHYLKQLSSISAGNPMLINEDGYWLYGGKPDHQWAFMFPNKMDSTVATVYPELWQKIKQTNKGFIKTSQGQFIFKHLDAGSEIFKPGNIKNKYDNLLKNMPVWYIVERIPPGYISQQLVDSQYFLIAFFVLVTLILALGINALLKAIEKKQLAEEKIEHMALYDSLTEVANRVLFRKKMKEELERFKRENNEFALMYLDLDNFKPINDQLGHQAGDLTLKEVAHRLSPIFRTLDTFARLGGDEFAVILPKPGSKQDLEIIAQRIIDMIAKPISIEGHQFSLGITIGISVVNESDESINDIITRADNAMYHGKNHGKNQYYFAS